MASTSFQPTGLTTRIHRNSYDEDWPSLNGNRHTRNPISLPPVILKVTDSKANFRQMDMAKLKAMVQDNTNQTGAPKHADTPCVEDLFIFQTDYTQKGLPKNNQCSQ
uniref:Uncharacterized protein n=1 Tax=Daphnia galeata TaxID=27404 RepID=A0A8J2RAM0_9CRUS|nr:unnamed protein product [Daphnia galeata]